MVANGRHLFICRPFCLPMASRLRVTHNWPSSLMRLGEIILNKHLHPKAALAAMIAVSLAFICLSTQSAAETSASFAEMLGELTANDFRAKTDAVQSLELSDDPRALVVLQAMLDGHLYYRKASKALVYAERIESGFELADVLSGEHAGTAGRKEVKKVSVNNRLRTVIRGVIARLSLSNPDPELRLAAVKHLYHEVGSETSLLLREMLENEREQQIVEAIRAVLALTDLESENVETRLSAIETLRGNLEPDVRIRLVALTALDSEGNYVEINGIVREAALEVLRGIDRRLRAYRGLETVFFGISLGSVLVLAAIGLAITFGVMGVINMAHGELIMLGAYTTYVVQLLMPNHIDMSIFVAIPAAFFVSGLFGIIIERGVIRFLYGRPLETLLATFGISLFLQQTVRTVFSPLNRSVITPSWMSGSIQINSALSLTLNRLYIVIFTLLVFAAILYVMKYTSLGLRLRAVSQNRPMAKAMGIRADWVDAFTFGLGSGIAGVAGVALSQLTNVGPNLGTGYIIDSFMVVVFGGVGNLWGTLISGMSLGIANKFLEPLWGAVLAKILILIFIIIFIQMRPRGLFPQRGRAAEF